MIDTLTSASLTFDPALHEYRLPDGRRVPSVTEILSAVGVSVDFEAIGGMSARLAEQIDLRRQLGTAVHLDAHAFDDDDLDWDSVDPRVEPYVRAWATLRLNKQLTPTARERVVFDPTWFYCGTLDGIFRTPSGARILIDIKTGDPRDGGCQFQTAAYAAAYQIEHPQEPIDARWGVQLVPEREVPYLITPYTDWRDCGSFHAFVTTYTNQSARRSAR